MALQDLTPQLRTRLSRMERAVGWFVIIATALLLFGFGYYVYSVADRKGWFVSKVLYSTSISSGAGLKVGDPVKLMGFDVGEITAIIPNDPYADYNITVYFWIKKPNYGYIWSDSSARVVAGDLLGNRYLEVSKGRYGVPTVREGSDKEPLGILLRPALQTGIRNLSGSYTNEARLMGALGEVVRENPAPFYTNLIIRETAYWLYPEESRAVTERLEALVKQVEDALPNILNLTNQLSTVLSNSSVLTAHLSDVALAAKPAFSNIASATANLDHPGALGEWLLPTNLSREAESVLRSANSTLAGADTNLSTVAQRLDLVLVNLANVTSNLNHQVESNTNILGQISKAVVDADDLVQGLKRHWFLRSAFKNNREENEPTQPVERLQSPKDQSTR